MEGRSSMETPVGPSASASLHCTQQEQVASGGCLLFQGHWRQPVWHVHCFKQFSSSHAAPGLTCFVVTPHQMRMVRVHGACVALVPPASLSCSKAAVQLVPSQTSSHTASSAVVIIVEPCAFHLCCSSYVIDSFASAQLLFDGCRVQCQSWTTHFVGFLQGAP